MLSYTVQVVKPNVRTKFQTPRCSFLVEIFDTNFPMDYIGVREGKNENQNKTKYISALWFSFIQYNTIPLGVYKI